MLFDLAEQIFRKLHPDLDDTGSYHDRVVQEIQFWLATGPVPDVPDVDRLANEYRQAIEPPAMGEDQVE